MCFTANTTEKTQGRPRLGAVTIYVYIYIYTQYIIWIHMMYPLFFFPHEPPTWHGRWSWPPWTNRSQWGPPTAPSSPHAQGPAGNAPHIRGWTGSSWKTSLIYVESWKTWKRYVENDGKTRSGYDVGWFKRWEWWEWPGRFAHICSCYLMLAHLPTAWSSILATCS